MQSSHASFDVARSRASSLTTTSQTSQDSMKTFEGSTYDERLEPSLPTEPTDRADWKQQPLGRHITSDHSIATICSSST